MFLLPSIVVGLVLAVVLGGRPSRVLEVRLRGAWAVFVALGLQIVLFSRLGEWLPQGPERAAHVATYGLLGWFALANRRSGALLPAMAGMFLNAVAIAANGGAMPIDPRAARVAGVLPEDFANVSPDATRLAFLGDVFALPGQLPFANTFSIGDVLIGAGMAAFIVVSSFDAGAAQPRPPLAERLAPLRLRSYRRLLGGKLVSSVGDWLTLAALVGWIYEATASTGAVGAVLAARLGPPIVGASAAAYLVDRLPKRGLLVGVEVARAVAVAAALAGVLAGSVPAVLAALAASGALAALSAATVPALVPAIVPPDQLPLANAGLGIVRNSAMALGASGAGVALAWTGASAALVVDLVTFALAALLFRGLDAPAATQSGGPAKERVSARRYLLARPKLLALVGAFAAATFATGLVNTTLPRFLETELGIGPAGYAFAIASLAIGLALGEASVGFTRVGGTAGRWIGVGLALTAGLLGLLALGREPHTVFLLIALIGFVDGSTDILFDLAVQRGTEGGYLGAVFGVASTAMSTTMVLAFAVAPLLASVFDASGVMLVAGAAFLVGGVVATAAVSRERGALRAVTDAPGWG